MELLHTLFYFILAIGVLVSFHEFGHFWIARKANVKVLRFSIGFGKILWSLQKTPTSTEYVISAIPLGGYVKMVDEREGEVIPEDLPYAFNRQPVLTRAAIVAAGPLFNLVLAIALFWSVLVIGEEGMKPILGKINTGTLAASAGFQEGDEIIAVDDKKTPTWTETMSVIIAQALEGNATITVTVKTQEDKQLDRSLIIPEQDAQNADTLYKRLGFTPWSPKLKAIIGHILPNSAALEAGLKENDLIINADKYPINDWMEWVNYVKKRPNQTIHATIERDGVRLPIAVTPRAVTVEGQTEGKIGAAVYIPEELMKSVTVKYSLPPIKAIPAALKTTYYYSVTTLKMLGKMLIGKASVENLSGPISIAQYAGQSAEMGLVHFLKFLALISVSLGVLNLLPIPILDGGHLLFFALEGIKGSPVSEKTLFFFQQIGMVFLVSLMLLAMVLDVNRLFP